MAKARIIMRDMIGMMLLGQTPDYQTYETLSRIPEVIDSNTYSGCYFDKEKDGEKAVLLSGEMRNIAKTDLIMRTKTRVIASEGHDLGSPSSWSNDGSGGASASGRRWTKASGTGIDGTVDDDDDDEDDVLEEEVEGDDLNASDDADDDADGDADREADVMDDDE